MVGTGEPFWPEGCVPGCITVLLLIAALQLFDWKVVGAGCLLFVWASALFMTVRNGRFEWRRGARGVVRAERPRLYWGICLLMMAGMIIALGGLLRELAMRGTAF